jgi:hypothetical protein
MKSLVKRGLELLLAGTLLFNGMSFAKPFEKKESGDVLEYVASLPQEKQVIDHRNVKLPIMAWESMRESKMAASDVSYSYVSPSTGFSYGKNKIQYRPMKWKGFRVDDRVKLFFNEGYEEIGEIEGTLIKETIEKYEKVLDHKFDKKIEVFVYDPYTFRQTNIIPQIITGNLGGMFEPLKKAVIVPWTSNRFVKHVTAHEVFHSFIEDLIFKQSKKHKKPFYFPLWINEAFAQWMTGNKEMYKRAIETTRDLTLNGNIVPVHRLGQSLLMYTEGPSFLDYLEKNYGGNRFALLFKNWYSIFDDKDELIEKEDIFGNVVSEKRVKTGLFSNITREKMMDYAFRKTYGKGIRQLDSEWRGHLMKKFSKESEGKDKIEEIVKRVCPEQFCFSPVFNGNTLAYITLNKSKTALSLKIIGDKGGGKYDIKSMDSFTKEITNIGKLHDSRMDINKNHLVFSFMSKGKDKLYFYDLKNKILSGKAFEELIEINDPAISSDSKKVVFSGLDKKGYYDIYVLDTRTNNLKRLTHDLYFEKDFDFKDNSYDVVFSTDKTHDGNYDVCMIKDLSKIEKIISADSDDENPRFTPSGKIAFISDRNSENMIDNLFLLDTEEDEIYQMTNVINPIKDVFWSENKKGEEKILVTYFRNMSVNVGDLKKFNIRPVARLEEIADEAWQYKKEKFKDQDFTRRFGVEIGGLNFGVNEKMLLIESLFSDRLRDLYLGFGAHLIYKRLEDANFYLKFMDRRKKIPYMVGIDRFVYYNREDGRKMSIKRGSFSFNYPLNITERISNTSTIIHSNANSEDFFEGTPYEILYRPEVLPDYKKGFRLSDIVSYTKDNMFYSWQGPVEGHGYKLNLRTKFKPKLEGMLASVSLSGDARFYKKLGGFGVAGIKVAGGFGGGKEAEKFGVGNILTLKGYGTNVFGLVPEFFGKGYYLFNAEISQIPLIEGLIIPGKKIFPGIYGSLYFNMGNAFNNLTKIRKPKVSIGFGLHSYFILPLSVYFSIPFGRKEGKRGRIQAFMGYNF